MEDNIITEVKCILLEKDLKDTINKNIKICCPKCHSQKYDIYPTPQISITVLFAEEDLHWTCLKCGYIFNSYFVGYRYDYQKSAIEGRISEKFKREHTIYAKLRTRFRQIFFSIIRYFKS